MRTTILAILFASTLWAVPALAAVEPCAGAGDHVAERACLEHEAKVSGQALSAKEQELLSAIASWGDSSDDQMKARSRQFFQKGRSGFKHYRQSQCEFEASAAAGGNGAGDMRLQCIIRLNRERLGSLQEQLIWFK